MSSNRFVPNEAFGKEAELLRKLKQAHYAEGLAKANNIHHPVSLQEIKNISGNQDSGDLMNSKESMSPVRMN